MNAQKKEQIAAYKEREVVGGVYAIRNALSGWKILETTTDMRGSRNRFDFARKNNMCVHKRMEDDWRKSGASAFTFEVVEELTKDPTQTMENFQADVAALKELCLEKFLSEGAPPLSKG
jgi:hypothetical protein